MLTNKKDTYRDLGLSAIIIASIGLAGFLNNKIYHSASRVDTSITSVTLPDTQIYVDNALRDSTYNLAKDCVQAPFGTVVVDHQPYDLMQPDTNTVKLEALIVQSVERGYSIPRSTVDVVQLKLTKSIGNISTDDSTTNQHEVTEGDIFVYCSNVYTQNISTTP